MCCTFWSLHTPHIIKVFVFIYYQRRKKMPIHDHCFHNSKHFLSTPLHMWNIFCSLLARTSRCAWCIPTFIEVDNLPWVFDTKLFNCCFEHCKILCERLVSCTLNSWFLYSLHFMLHDLRMSPHNPSNHSLPGDLLVFENGFLIGLFQNTLTQQKWFHLWSGAAGYHLEKLYFLPNHFQFHMEPVVFDQVL